MVKRKNHTNRNLSVKCHRNGIKKPKGWTRKVKSLKARGFKGMDPLFRRNQKFVQLGLKKAKRKKRLEERQKKTET